MRLGGRRPELNNCVGFSAAVRLCKKKKKTRAVGCSPQTSRQPVRRLIYLGSLRR